MTGGVWFICSALRSDCVQSFWDQGSSAAESDERYHHETRSHTHLVSHTPVNCCSDAHIRLLTSVNLQRLFLSYITLMSHTHMNITDIVSLLETTSDNIFLFQSMFRYF